jgi:hypothetical protein
MSEEHVIICDLEVDGWTVAEADAYRKAVGVNAEYAWGIVQRAVKESLVEARELYGEAVDEPGWQPPADWAPLAMLNLDPLYLAGFAFVAARREEPGLAFETLAGQLRLGELVSSFYGQLTALAEERPPLAAQNREQRRAAAKSGPRKTAATPSAASTAGAKRRSTP